MDERLIKEARELAEAAGHLGPELFGVELLPWINAVVQMRLVVALNTLSGMP